MERTHSYTVRQLARLAGISVRTLHHYHHIGLLLPAERSSAGYRLYRHPELLRLQQILFYKELDVPLEEIRRILGQPGFDSLHALEEHHRKLHHRLQRLENLLHTIDKTIQSLKETDMTLTDAELYAGFTQEQKERYEREVNQKYDPALVEESHRRLRKMTKSQWQAVKEEGDAVTRQLAKLIDSPVEDPSVQAAVARHHAWIENFFPANAQVYRALGNGYAENPEFREFYDKYHPGLADFMSAAMEYYAAHSIVN